MASVVAILSFTAPSEVVAGSVFTVTADLMEGNMEPGTAWGHIKDADTGEIVSIRRDRVLSGGDSWTWSWPLTMPDKNWNLLIEVGHVEAE